MGRLDGKVALVTGGTQGIGAAIVEAFAKENAKVGFTGRKDELGKNLCEKLKEKEVSYFRADMRVRSDLEQCVLNLLKKYGKIDILVNNAGIFPVRSFLEIDEKELDDVIQTNQKGVFLITQCVAKKMAETKSGNIINISSIQGVQGFAVQSHYTATKGAMIALTRGLAVELGGYGVRVNSIAPGAIITETLANTIPVQFTDIIKKQTPLGHLATIEDIASCAVFLASEESKSITGELITIDGGYTACRTLN